ncbi:MAG: hypothetical protein HQ450_04455 [Alcaligenaceae bacterium]|nr:hypothetical protein [Alcaligenaceae bacterium]
MDIQGRIFQSIRPRRDGVLLRSDLSAIGGRSQVSVALSALCAKGLIQRIERGVYVTPQKLALLGKQVLLDKAHQRQAALRQKLSMLQRREALTLTPTARHVDALAKRLGISYTPTFGDRWAIAVTRLAGDDVSSDRTDDLLVALTRAGKLSPTDMAKMAIEHHRMLRAHV